MDQPSLINIHTHSPARPGEWALQNIHSNFSSLPATIFSAGLHPWFLDIADYGHQFDELIRLSNNKNMIALGECGLDKVCTTPYALQKEVFVAQVKLANKIRKPLILHCVRAHEDVMHLLEEHNNTVPVIFHGFNKGPDLAKRIAGKGYYLSFGTALQKPLLQEVFAQVGMDHIFLETDDADISITSIYEIAAGIRHISVEELNLRLKQNLQKVFNISL